MSLGHILEQLHASYGSAAVLLLAMAYVFARGAIHALDTALRVVGFIGAQIRADLLELRKTWLTTRKILGGKPHKPASALSARKSEGRQIAPTVRLTKPP